MTSSRFSRPHQIGRATRLTITRAPLEAGFLSDILPYEPRVPL
jgi:hypothetical protein